MKNKSKDKQIRNMVRKIIFTENNDSSSLDQPENSIDGKYSNKRSIVNAVYDVLKKAKVEGVYMDDNWQGVKKLANALADAGIDFSLQKSNYAGHNSLFSQSQLPTRKEYVYFLNIRDKSGKENHLPLKVTCAFVGKTGTMEDDVYELTYVIEA